MGICMSAEQKAAAARSAALDRQLDKDRLEANKTIKLLLLGELTSITAAADRLGCQREGGGEGEGGEGEGEREGEGETETRDRERDRERGGGEHT